MLTMIRTLVRDKCGKICKKIYWAMLNTYWMILQQISAQQSFFRIFSRLTFRVFAQTAVCLRFHLATGISTFSRYIRSSGWWSGNRVTCRILFAYRVPFSCLPMNNYVVADVVLARWLPRTLDDTCIYGLRLWAAFKAPEAFASG